VAALFKVPPHFILLQYVRMPYSSLKRTGSEQIYQYSAKHFFKLSQNGVFVKIKTPEFMPEIASVVKHIFLFFI
jgi:hypothetical protein